MVIVDIARQVRPVAGFTVGVSVIVPVKEPVPVAVIVERPAAFALTVKLVGFAASVKPPVTTGLTWTVRMNVFVTGPPLVLLVPVNVTRYVLGVDELKVQTSRADPPEPIVTLVVAHVTVRPVAGLVELLNFTCPKNPRVLLAATIAGTT